MLAGGGGAQIIYLASSRQSVPRPGVVLPHVLLPLGYEKSGAGFRCLAWSLKATPVWAKVWDPGVWRLSSSQTLRLVHRSLVRKSVHIGAAISRRGCGYLCDTVLAASSAAA